MGSLPTIRRSLPLTCYFKLPDQGMKSYAVLSRGTCFLTPSLGESSKNRVHILASAHVVSPFNFPQYFTEDWLSFVSQSDCKYSIHIDGDTTIELENDPVHHPGGADVSALRLSSEDVSLQKLYEYGTVPLILDDKQTAVRKTLLMVDGFEVTDDDSDDSSGDDDDFFSEGQSNDNDDRDNRVHVHQIVESLVVSNNLANQHLASTAATLTDGYCGAPICRQDDDLRCVGIVEGTVSENSKETSFHQCASYIPSPHLKAFLEGVVER